MRSYRDYEKLRKSIMKTLVRVFCLSYRELRFIYAKPRIFSGKNGFTSKGEK